jgi:N6-L-threonylcarbamoyladenine synthase
MIVLGFETSCDETAVAVVRRGGEDAVLSEAIKSQIPLHAPYGGIVPEIASRTHFQAIGRLTETALQESGVSLNDVELLALTQGPGLIGSLLVGLSFAKGLALARHLPLVGVDHIQAHIEAAFITHPGIRYPLLALVVSGGHTTLFLQEEKFSSRVLAKTRDDAAGEVMDKIAKHFGLGYPGGPLLDQVYGKGNPAAFSFTPPRMSDGGDDFSFSGYKAAALRLAQTHAIPAGSPAFFDLLSSFLNALVEYLVGKTLAAAVSTGARSLVVAGGVSRNRLLRARFSAECARRNLPLYLPEPAYCTDNASMIAWLGYEKFTAFPGADYSDLFLNAYARAPFRATSRHR